MAERDLNSVASPRLDDAQMAALGRCAGATPFERAVGAPQTREAVRQHPAGQEALDEPSA